MAFREEIENIMATSHISCGLGIECNTECVKCGTDRVMKAHAAVLREIKKAIKEGKACDCWEEFWQEYLGDTIKSVTVKE